MNDDAVTAPSPRRGWAILVAGCPIVAAAIGRRMRYDSGLQDSIASAQGVVALVLLWAAFAIGVRQWTRGRRERALFLFSAAVGTAIVMGVVVLGNLYGWLAGAVVRPPLAVQLLVYTLHVFALVLLPLAAYRHAARRRPLLALLGFLVWVCFFSAVSVPAERAFIAEGVVSYQNGYTMREDILWGAVMYLSALAIYLGLLRRASS